MNVLNITNDIAIAKQRARALKNLNSQVVPLREQVAQKEFVVRQCEIAVNQVATQIADLESFSLESLLQSVLMRKERRLDELKEEFTRLEEQIEAAEKELADFQAQLAQVELQVAGLSGADEDYQSLMNKKCDELLSGEGDSSTELRTLIQTVDATKVLRSTLRNSRQTARRALDRLRTATTVKNRSRMGVRHGLAGGLIVGLAVEAVKRTTAAPVAARASEGLLDLLQSIEKIPIECNDPRDQHLVELTQTLRSHTHQASSKSDPARSPRIVENIHQIMANLDERIETCEAAIKMLTGQREQLLEQS
ncbi:MAG: hypothetical protein HY287_08755 [Planctomycetes bacterium]|nr:hypothetical protein [Planctomycetota bacterium]MBI3834403.1 hypothetical protein [Planctomycetota bacterium]